MAANVKNEGGLMDGEGFAGLVDLTPQAQLGILFPRLKEGLKSVKVEILPLGCDRHVGTSDIDPILEKARIWLPQTGYKRIVVLSEPVVVGRTIFLGGTVYLVNGFDSQVDGIGLAVHGFFKSAYEECATRQNNEQVYHYMAVIDCPKGKAIVLATLL